MYLLNNANTLDIYLKNTGGNTAGNAINYTPDEWLHIGYSWDGTTVTWYTNGVNSGTSSLSGTLACSAGNLTFGESADGYLYYGGLMSEVRIWNIARSEVEIQADMYKELTGTEEGLVGYWKLNEGSGIIAYDSSVNDNHGTLYGDPIWFTGSG